ncbi:hypothetical protein QBC35DRAFT_395258, partial [Podospora australis]
YPLVLGSRFLRLTETLTTFRHRIKKAFATKFGSPRLTAFFWNPDDSESCCLRGKLGEKNVTAVPDTGSECSLIPLEYARKRRFFIDNSMQHHHELEFIDGSRQTTFGTLQDIEWQLGKGERTWCDFLVLEGLPVDVLLGNGLVEEFHVFEEHEASPMFGGQDEGGTPGMYGVTMLGQYGVELSNLESEYWSDLNTPDPFSRQMILKESTRRNAIQQRISCLPHPEQEEAHNLEIQRQTE